VSGLLKIYQVYEINLDIANKLDIYINIIKNYIYSDFWIYLINKPRSIVVVLYI